jgi:predicted ATPase/class 3 adenylate cyclase
MDESGSVATFVFTDIEGSSRLWEREPARMQRALAMHDHAGRACVEKHGGHVIKMTGDGMCAVFADPLGAIDATLAFQQALAQAQGAGGLELRARCGIHAGTAQRRDDDYFGSTLNRAARIMGAAHGGQVLVSQSVVDLVRGRLPDAISLRDLGLVRLRDLTSPERLYQLQHPSLRQAFPALRSLEATPNNLPQQATSFVGRERELEDARKALGRTRLLTLVGAGGIGKTRLSLQLAAEVLDDYADGVWFVELAPLGDERLVLQAVATALGVKEEGGASLVDSLVRDIVDKRLLLVLDNCEHVLGACASLAERLLRGSAGLRILASSREPLRIPGEATYPVPTLAVPAAGASEGDPTFASYPAVRLFAERASAVLPSFQLDAANGRTVGAICRHLDGIPLAIELAAARARVMSVATIASRLDDRFRLLSSGSRTALPRQQTLRALIDWSHDLLQAPERELFRRLSVFAGGWTLEAAEAVCAGDEVQASETLELLSGLVDKSLVVADLASGRYSLLETIRQYAGEKLDASAEGNALRERHLDYYLGLAETAERHLNGPGQATWLGRLVLDDENLLAANAWCDHAADGGEKGLRLVNALKAYWFYRGMLPLGKRAILEALQRSGASGRTRVRSVALFGLGQFCSFAGAYEEAIGHLEESLGIARALGDSARVAATLQPLSFAELGCGRLADARRHAEESVVLARDLRDDKQLAAALNAVAQICRMQGDLAAAEQLYDQVIALGRRLGSADLIAIGLLNVSMVYIQRGVHGSVRTTLQEILAIAAENHSMPIGQSALEVAAGYAAALDEPELALRIFGAVEANTRLTGLSRDPTDDAFLQPLIRRAREALGAESAARAEAAGHEAGYEAALGAVGSWLESASSRPAGAPG